VLKQVVNGLKARLLSPGRWGATSNGRTSLCALAFGIQLRMFSVAPQRPGDSQIYLKSGAILAAVLKCCQTIALQRTDRYNLGLQFLGLLALSAQAVSEAKLMWPVVGVTTEI